VEFLSKILDFLLHLDKHLSAIIQGFGLWTYFILFFIIFLETGFVVTPFLPGDSLLFAAGIFKKEYLERTHGFYERYGAETIIIARFVPIVRTFAPFVAGIGRMSYWKFISYNVIGGVGWVAAFVFGGYFFGNIPIVKKNFSLVILVIIIVSMIPAAVEFVRHRGKARRENPGRSS
jgi:membrane-associated protein